MSSHNTMNRDLFRLITTLKAQGVTWEAIAQRVQRPMAELEELPWRYRKQWEIYYAWAEELVRAEVLAKAVAKLLAAILATTEPKILATLSGNLTRLMKLQEKKTPKAKATPKSAPDEEFATDDEFPGNFDHEDDEFPNDFAPAKPQPQPAKPEPVASKPKQTGSFAAIGLLFLMVCGLGFFASKATGHEPLPFDAGGIAEGSRWLSPKGDTTGNEPERSTPSILPHKVLVFDPEGIAEGSRWLSRFGDTTGTPRDRNDTIRTPRDQDDTTGTPALCDPFRVENHCLCVPVTGGVALRAQPPATLCDPFRVENPEELIFGDVAFGSPLE